MGGEFNLPKYIYSSLTLDECIVQMLKTCDTCPAEILARVSKAKGQWLRKLVAKHPNTSSETLAELSLDISAEVRQCVYDNPNYKGKVGPT